MNISDAVKTSIRGLKHAKTRSFLTMLGIVIGIASVIILMSIGSSAQQLIISQVQGVGSNLVFVIPGATKGSQFASPASVQGIIIKTLVKRDVDMIKREAAVQGVSGEVRGQGKVVYGNNDTTVTFNGVSEDFFTIRNFATTKGYIFTRSDVDGVSRVAVLGSEIAKTLFGERDPVGKNIRLKDVTFRVVGVLEKKGLGPFGVDQDNMILIPVTTAQKQMVGIDYYNSVTVQTKDGYDSKYVQGRIATILRQDHRITDPDKDDFTIRAQEDALALLGNVTSVLTAFLTSIAFISLLVGGIGIMNIMLVSVIERTKEIGLRKAVGATNIDILQQFLFESVIITFIGGVIGITIGASVTTLIYIILTKVLAVDWAFSLPASAIILSMAVSSFTGLVFGIYPARQASLKSPIEALRYE